MALATREVELVLIARDRASPVLARLGGSFAGISRNLGRATALMSRHLTMVTKEYVEFTQQSALTFTQVENVANATQKAIEESTKRIARTIPRELQQIASSFYDLFSTIDVKDMKQAEQAVTQFAKAATTGQAPMESITRSTIGWLNALDRAPTLSNINKLLNIQFELVRKGAGTYEEITREVGKAIPAIVKANQSVETFAGSFAFLTRNALNSAMAATSVARATELLYSRKAVEGLRKYGIAVSDAAGKTREMVDIIQDMLPYFRGKSIAERVTVFHDMFGQGRIQARRFFDTVIPNFEEWKRLVEEMKEAVGEGVFEKNFAFMMEQPLSRWQLLVNRFQVLRLEVGENIWKDVNKYLVPAIDKLLTWWEKLTPASKRAVVQITVFGTALLGLTSIVFGVLSAITLLVALITSFPLQFGAAGIALGVFGASLKNILPAFKDNWDVIRSKIETTISKSVTAVQDGNYKIWRLWKQLFKDLGKILGIWTPEIQAKWNAAFEDWITPLKWAWDNTIGAIHEMVTDSQGKIRESYKKLFSEITTGLIGLAGFILGRDPITKVFSAGILVSQLDDMAPAVKEWYKTTGKRDLKQVFGNIGTGIRDMLENELAFDFGVGAIPDLWATGFIRYWREEWRQNISPDIERAVTSFKKWWDGHGKEFTNVQFDKIWDTAIETINTIIKSLLNVLKTIAYIFASFSGVSEDQLKKLRDYENTDWNLLITSITDPVTSLLGIVQSVLTTISSAISFDGKSVTAGMKELNAQLLDIGPKLVRGFFAVVNATLAGLGIIAASGLNLEPAIQKTAEQIVLSLHETLDRIPVLNWFVRDPNAKQVDTSGAKGPLFGTLGKLPVFAGLAGLAGLAGYGWLRGGNVFEGLGRGASGLFKGGFKGGLVGAGLGGLAHIMLGFPLGMLGAFSGAGAIAGGFGAAAKGFKSSMGKPIRGAKFAAGSKMKENILRRFGVETPRMEKERVRAERVASKAAKDGGSVLFEGADDIPSKAWDLITEDPKITYDRAIKAAKEARRLDNIEIDEMIAARDRAKAAFVGKEAEIARLRSMVDISVAEAVANAQDAMSRATVSKLTNETKKKILETTNVELRLSEVHLKIQKAQTAIKNLETAVDDTALLKTINTAREKLRTLEAKMASLSSQGGLSNLLSEHGEGSLKVRAAELRVEIAEAVSDLLNRTEGTRLAGVSADVKLQLESARVKLNNLEVSQVQLEEAIATYDAKLKRHEDIIKKQGYSEQKQAQMLEQIRKNKRTELLGTIAGKETRAITDKKKADKLNAEILELIEGRNQRFILATEQAKAKRDADAIEWPKHVARVTKIQEQLAKKFGIRPERPSNEVQKLLGALPQHLGLSGNRLVESLNNIIKGAFVSKAETRHLFTTLGLYDKSLGPVKKLTHEVMRPLIEDHIRKAMKEVLEGFTEATGEAAKKATDEFMSEMPTYYKQGGTRFDTDIPDVFDEKFFRKMTGRAQLEKYLDRIILEYPDAILNDLTDAVDERLRVLSYRRGFPRGEALRSDRAYDIVFKWLEKNYGMSDIDAVRHRGPVAEFLRTGDEFLSELPVIGHGGDFHKAAERLVKSIDINYHRLTIPSASFDEIFDLTGYFFEYLYENTLENLMTAYVRQFGADLQGFVARLYHSRMEFPIDEYFINEWRNVISKTIDDEFVLQDVFFRGSDFVDNFMSYYTPDARGAIGYAGQRTFRAIRLPLDELVIRSIPSDLFIEGYDELEGTFRNLADVIYGNDDIFLVSGRAKALAEEGLLGTVVGSNSARDAYEAFEFLSEEPIKRPDYIKEALRRAREEEKAADKLYRRSKSYESSGAFDYHAYKASNKFHSNMVLLPGGRAPYPDFDRLLELSSFFDQRDIDIDELFTAYRTQHSDDVKDFAKRLSSIGFELDSEDLASLMIGSSKELPDIRISDIFYRGSEFHDSIMSYYAANLTDALEYASDRTIRMIRLDIDNLSFNRIPGDILIQGYDLIRDVLGNTVDVVTDETAWAIYLSSARAMESAKKNILATIVGPDSIDYADAEFLSEEPIRRLTHGDSVTSGGRTFKGMNLIRERARRQAESIYKNQMSFDELIKVLGERDLGDIEARTEFAQDLLNAWKREHGSSGKALKNFAIEYTSRLGRVDDESAIQILRSLEGLHRGSEFMSEMPTKFAAPEPQIVQKLQNRLMDWNETLFDRTSLPYMAYEEVVRFIERFLDDNRPLYSGEQALVDLIRAYKIQFGPGEDQMWDFIEKTEELRNRIQANARDDMWEMVPRLDNFQVEKIWDEVEMFNEKVLRNIVYRGAQTGDQVYSFFSESIETALRFVERHELPTLLAAKMDFKDLKMVEVSSTPFHMPRSELRNWFDADILVHRYDFDEWAYLLMTEEAQEATTRLNLTMQQVEGYVLDYLKEGNRYRDIYDIGRHWDGTEAGTLFVNALEEYSQGLYYMFNEQVMPEFFMGEEEDIVEAIERLSYDMPHSVDDFMEEIGNIVRKHEFVSFSDFIDEGAHMPGGQMFSEIPTRGSGVNKLIDDIREVLSVDLGDRWAGIFDALNITEEPVESLATHMNLVDNMLEGLSKRKYSIHDLISAGTIEEGPYDAMTTAIANYIHDRGFAILDQPVKATGEELLGVIAEHARMKPQSAAETLYRMVESFTEAFGHVGTGKDKFKKVSRLDLLYPNLIDHTRDNYVNWVEGVYDKFRETLVHEWIHHVQTNTFTTGSSLSGMVRQDVINDVSKLFRTKEFKRFIKGMLWGGMDLHGGETNYRYPGEAQGIISDIFGRKEEAYTGRYNRDFFMRQKGLMNFQEFEGIVKFADEILHAWIRDSEDTIPVFEELYSQVENYLKSEGVHKEQLKIILRELKHSRDKLMRKPFGIYDDFLKEALASGEFELSSYMLPIKNNNSYRTLSEQATRVAAKYHFRGGAISSVQGSKSSSTGLQTLIVEYIGEHFDRVRSLGSVKFKKELEDFIIGRGGDKRIDWIKEIGDELNTLNKYNVSGRTMGYYNIGGAVAASPSIVVPSSKIDSYSGVYDLSNNREWGRFTERYKHSSIANYIKLLGSELSWEDAVKRARGASAELDVDELNRASRTIVRYIRGEMLTVDDLHLIARTVSHWTEKPLPVLDIEQQRKWIDEALNITLARMSDNLGFNTEEAAKRFVQTFREGVTTHHKAVFLDWLPSAYSRLKPEGIFGNLFTSIADTFVEDFRPTAKAVGIGKWGGTTTGGMRDSVERIIKSFGINPNDSQALRNFIDNVIRSGRYSVENLQRIFQQSEKASDDAYTRFAQEERVRDKGKYRRRRKEYKWAGDGWFAEFTSKERARRAYEKAQAAGTGGRTPPTDWKKVFQDPLKWTREELARGQGKVTEPLRKLLNFHMHKAPILGRKLPEDILAQLKAMGFTPAELGHQSNIARIVKGIFSRPSLEEYTKADDLRRALLSGEANWADQPGFKFLGGKFKRTRFYLRDAAWMPDWAKVRGTRFATKALGPLGWGIDIAQEIPGQIREQKQVSEIDKHLNYTLGSWEEFGLRMAAIGRSAVSLGTFGVFKPEEINVEKYMFDQAKAQAHKWLEFTGEVDRLKEKYLSDPATWSRSLLNPRRDQFTGPLEYTGDDSFFAGAFGVSPGFYNDPEANKRFTDALDRKIEEEAILRPLKVLEDIARRDIAFKLAARYPNLIEPNSSMAIHQAEMLDLYKENPPLLKAIEKELVTVEEELNNLIHIQAMTPVIDYRYWRVDRGITNPFVQQNMEETNRRQRAYMSQSIAIVRDYHNSLLPFVDITEEQKAYVRNLASVEPLSIMQYMRYRDATTPEYNYEPLSTMQYMRYRGTRVNAMADFIAAEWTNELMYAMSINDRLKEGFGTTPAQYAIKNAEGIYENIPNPYYDISRAWRNYTGDRAYQFDPDNIQEIMSLYDADAITKTGLRMKGMIGSIKESVAHWLKDGVISDDEMQAMNLLYDSGFIQQTGIIDEQIKKRIQIEARGWARSRTLVKNNLGSIADMLETGMMTEIDLIETGLGSRMQDVFQRAFTIDNENLWYNLIQFRDLIASGQWLPDEITTGKLMDLIDAWLSDGLQSDEIWQLGYLIGNDIVDGIDEGIIAGFADTLVGIPTDVLMTKLITQMYGAGKIGPEQYQRLLDLYGPQAKPEDFIRAGHMNLLPDDPNSNLITMALDFNLTDEANDTVKTLATFLESGNESTVAAVFESLGGTFTTEMATAMSTAVEETTKLAENGVLDEFMALFDELGIPDSEAILAAIDSFASNYSEKLTSIRANALLARFAIRDLQCHLNFDTACSPIPNVVIGKSLQKLVNIYGGNMGDLIHILTDTSGDVKDTSGELTRYLIGDAVDLKNSLPGIMEDAMREVRFAVGDGIQVPNMVIDPPHIPGITIPENFKDKSVKWNVNTNIPTIKTEVENLISAIASANPVLTITTEHRRPDGTPIPDGVDPASGDAGPPGTQTRPSRTEVTSDGSGGGYRPGSTFVGRRGTSFGLRMDSPWMDSSILSKYDKFVAAYDKWDSKFKVNDEGVKLRQKDADYYKLTSMRNEIRDWVKLNPAERKTWYDDWFRAQYHFDNLIEKIIQRPPPEIDTPPSTSPPTGSPGTTGANKPTYKTRQRDWARLRDINRNHINYYIKSGDTALRQLQNIRDQHMRYVDSNNYIGMGTEKRKFNDLMTHLLSYSSADETSRVIPLWFWRDRIPKAMKGGIVTRPMLSLIGEAGPEAIVPLSRLRHLESTPGARALPKEPDIYNYHELRNPEQIIIEVGDVVTDADPQEIANEIMWQLRIR